MYRKILFIVISFLFLKCEGNKTEKVTDEAISHEQNVEHKSIHQEEWEKYSKSKDEVSERNYKFVIDSIITLTNIESEKFTNPQFSKNGKNLFFTSINYNQIWVYDLTENNLIKIIDMPQCGIDFKVSENGDQIFFTNKTIHDKNNKSAYSILRYSIFSKKIEVVYTSTKRISSLVLMPNGIYFLENNEAKHLEFSNGEIDKNFPIPFYFVENNKLIKVTSIIDTILFENKNFEFVNVNYGEDLKTINTLTKLDGIILFDINGKPLNVFPSANYLCTLYKSNLLLLTEEKDDKDHIIESKLKIGFVNSNITLDVNTNENEFFFKPVWSPVENKIAYTSQDGQIKLISFNIEKVTK